MTRRRDDDDDAPTTRRPRRRAPSTSLMLVALAAALSLSLSLAPNGGALGQEQITQNVRAFAGDYTDFVNGVTENIGNVGDVVSEQISGATENLSGATENLSEAAKNAALEQAAGNVDSMTPEQLQALAETLGQDVSQEEIEAVQEAMANGDVSTEEIQGVLAGDIDPEELAKEVEAAAAEAGAEAPEMVQTAVVVDENETNDQGEGGGTIGDENVTDAAENMVPDQSQGQNQGGTSQQVGGESASGGSNFIEGIKGGISAWCKGMRDDPAAKPDCYDELSWLRYDLRMDFLSVYYCSIAPNDLDLTYTLCPGTYDTAESQRGGEMWGYGTLVLALPGSTLQCGGSEEDECALTSCFYDRESELMGPQVQVMSASDAAVHYGALSVSESVLAEYYDKDPEEAADPFADMALALGRVSEGRENFGMYLTGQAQAPAQQGMDDGTGTNMGMDDGMVGMNMFGDMGGGAGETHDLLDPPVTVKGMTFAGCEGGINVVCAARGRGEGDELGGVPESTVNFEDCHWLGNTGLAGVWIESQAYQIPRGMLKRLVDDDRGDGGVGGKEDDVILSIEPVDENNATIDDAAVVIEGEGEGDRGDEGGDGREDDVILSIQPVDYENNVTTGDADAVVVVGGEVGGETVPVDGPQQEQQQQGEDVGEIAVDEAVALEGMDEDELTEEGAADELSENEAAIDVIAGEDTDFTGTIVEVQEEQQGEGQEIGTDQEQVLDTQTSSMFPDEGIAAETTTMAHTADNLFFGGGRRNRKVRRHLQDGPYFQQGDFQGTVNLQGGGDDQDQDLQDQQGADPGQQEGGGGDQDLQVQQGADPGQQGGDQGQQKGEQVDPQGQSEGGQGEQGDPQEPQGEQQSDQGQSQSEQGESQGQSQGQQGDGSQGQPQQDDTQGQQGDSTVQGEQLVEDEDTPVDGGEEPVEGEQPVKGGEPSVGGDGAPVEGDGGEPPVQGDEGADQSVEGEGDEAMEPQMPDRGMIVNFEDCSFVDNYAAAALIVNTKGTAMFSNTEMLNNEAETIIANQLGAFLSLGNMCLEDNGFSGPSTITSDPQSSVDVGIPLFLNNINQAGWDDESGACSKGVWDGSENDEEGACMTEFGGDNTFCPRNEPDDIGSEIEEDVDAPEGDKSASTGGSSAATIGQQRGTGAILFALSPLLVGWFALY